MLDRDVIIYGLKAKIINWALRMLVLVVFVILVVIATSEYPDGIRGVPMVTEYLNNP